MYYVMDVVFLYLQNTPVEFRSEFSILLQFSTFVF